MQAEMHAKEASTPALLIAEFGMKEKNALFPLRKCKVINILLFIKLL
jgi:hypothetical protein